MSFRDEHTTDWRSRDVFHTIDAGFVHVRRIETLLGAPGMAVIDEQVERLPPILPAWQREVRIHHIYVRTMLMWCRANEIRTLGEILAARRGTMFCSNVELTRCRFHDQKRRAVNKILLPGNYPERIELHYSTQHIFGDTPRERLRDGGYPMSVIAELQKADNKTVIFAPLVMGSPWLEDLAGPHRAIEWYASDYFEQYAEDFDELSKIKDVAEPINSEPLRDVDEAAIKSCFGELLGDSIRTDWGGEVSDHYTSHIRLNGRRVTAAFVFKGPARFTPMGLNHLGKNNDQIVRLASEPADVLFVQHCHEILPQVRQTLRAFAVQPSRPRRYCLIDGRDTLRLLQAYGLLEKAVEQTFLRRKHRRGRRSRGAELGHEIR